MRKFAKKCLATKQQTNYFRIKVHILVGMLGVLFDVLGVLFGVLGVFFGVLGVLLDILVVSLAFFWKKGTPA